MKTTIQKRAEEIYSIFFTGSVFDITLLDSYLLENDLEVELLYTPYSLIYHREGSDIFIFTGVFESQFQKVSKHFITMCLDGGDLAPHRYSIDVLNMENPIIFRDGYVQGRFSKWLR